MSHIIIIEDSIKIPLNRVKPIYMVFNEAPSTNRKYQFQPDQQIQSNIITGLECGFFSTVTSSYPAEITLGGTTYQVLTGGDMCRIVVTFFDKKNKFLLRRIPLFSLWKSVILEQKIFELDLNIDSSYIEFLDAPVTAFPLVIPFLFYWDNKEL